MYSRLGTSIFEFCKVYKKTNATEFHFFQVLAWNFTREWPPWKVFPLNFPKGIVKNTCEQLPLDFIWCLWCWLWRFFLEMLSQPTFVAQSQQRKFHQNNVWNLFKVNNKGARTASLTWNKYMSAIFVCLVIQFLTGYQNCSTIIKNQRVYYKKILFVNKLVLPY